jgi:hypothetical protein
LLAARFTCTFHLAILRIPTYSWNEPTRPKAALGRRRSIPARGAEAFLVFKLIRLVSLHGVVR